MRGGSGGASRLATDFPCIASWSRDDLSAIADNTDAALTDAAVHALPDVQAWAKAHAALLEEVERAAARNEARRPELESLRSETRRAYEHARTLQAQWPAVERALHEARKRFMPFAMQSQLQMAANQLHDESEAFANAYVEVSLLWMYVHGADETGYRLCAPVSRPPHTPPRTQHAAGAVRPATSPMAGVSPRGTCVWRRTCGTSAPT